MSKKDEDIREILQYLKDGQEMLLSYISAVEDNQLKSQQELSQVIQNLVDEVKRINKNVEDLKNER